jgi:type IV pilus assembly protein PilB
MDDREYPSHLRPVPDAGGSPAPPGPPAPGAPAQGPPPPGPPAPGAPAQGPAQPGAPAQGGSAPGQPGPPVPPSEGSTAPQLDPSEGGTPGLTPPLTPGRSSGFVTDVLVDLGYVSDDRARQAIEEARTAGRPPERLMLEQGAINADQLSRAVAERYGLEHIDLSLFHVDMAAANLISVSTARRYKALPVGFVDKGTLLVAMADPTNVLAVDDIQIATALDCRVGVASDEDIEALIGRLNSLQSAVTEAVGEEEEEETALAAVESIEVSAEDAPVIKLVYSVLGQAVGEGASDVHFEPDEDGEMRVRFRVDGVLREAAHVPRRMVNAVVSRVKIMSELNIAEKRVPQDGRVSVTVDDRPVDLRVTTLPMQRGEGATIRILDNEKAQLELNDLGMGGEGRTRFEEAFHQAHGAVLVTGPTGSGKSTTLYAALRELNQVEKKIITIEDPVEYRLAGVNQMHVNRKAGLDFATGLRSILRADPDIVMVGEIRDGETARIAIEAALTGHMMLTTLHTNDAPGAITRLAKMGIEPFLVSSAVDCVVAQRLARKLCPHCKRRTILSQEALAELGIRNGVELEGYEPAGCGRCGDSGYRGRVGLYSVMSMSERLKDMTVDQAPESEITMAAREEGMRTLREDGLEKVRSGVTSLEEVLRVTA